MARTAAGGWRRARDAASLSAQRDWKGGGVGKQGGAGDDGKQRSLLPPYLVRHHELPLHRVAHAVAQAPVHHRVRGARVVQGGQAGRDRFGRVLGQGAGDAGRGHGARGGGPQHGAQVAQAGVDLKREEGRGGGGDGTGERGGPARPRSRLSSPRTALSCVANQPAACEASVGLEPAVAIA
jgi:hypothetical protein